MKNTIILSCLLLVVTLALTACTEQQRAREFGGSATVELPAGRKLVTATWKADHLWYLTRQMHTNEIAEEYEFRESSSFGLIEGKVVFKEKK